MKSKITKIKKSHDIRTPADAKMSWSDTAKAMVVAEEDWSEWDGVAADGMSGILSLFGTIDYDSDYDYKKTRKRTYEIIGPFHSVDDLMKSLNDE